MLWSQEVRLPEIVPDIFVPVTAAVGIIFALFLWWRVSAIKVRTGQRSTGEDGRTFLLEEELTGEDSVSLVHSLGSIDIVSRDRAGFLVVVGAQYECV